MELDRTIPVKALEPTVHLDQTKVAYFSMEIAVRPEMRTYAGGLGILAGDMLRSATDLGIPMVGVTLAYTHGYVSQEFDKQHWQQDREDPWDPSKQLIRVPETVTLTLAKKEVKVGAWAHVMKGTTGRSNVVLFLDTDLPENPHEFKGITSRLYAGEHRERLLQEAVLGIGGMKMLEALGAKEIRKYHMNEGHSALLTLVLLDRFKNEDYPSKKAKDFCVFTTHTPVSAGHDQFTKPLVEDIIGAYLPTKHRDDLFLGEMLNMTMLGLMHSGYVNGVAKRHGEVSREMFPGYAIESITNGVHAGTWVSPHLKSVYDRHFSGWNEDPYNLRYALAIPVDELALAHDAAKDDLVRLVWSKTGVTLRHDILTIGFARRATPYKRADFILGNVQELRRIAERTRGIQIVFAGKAHPQDHDGKLMIQRIQSSMGSFGEKLTIVYLPNYDMETAKTLVAGVDVWLNTPTRPQEASGTSGMKAALNGVPHLSILDGWWLEGHVENVTGWSIGSHPEAGNSSPEADRADLYAKLEYVILPRYYSEPEKWLKMMRSTIAINGSFFHTHRMVEQYVLNAYFR